MKDQKMEIEKMQAQFTDAQVQFKSELSTLEEIKKKQVEDNDKE